MISKFSIKRPFTVLVMVVMIIVFGFVAYTKMTPDLFPSMDLPYVVVMTSYFGATPEEVETSVTKPMEQQMSTLGNLKTMRSVSNENYSAIILEFDSDTNLDTISVDIRDKIDLVSGQWSDRVSKPIVLKLNPDMMPITVAAVSVKGDSNLETSGLLNKGLLRKLEGTDGVASVSTAGMVENTIQVSLNQDKIDKMNEKVQAAIISQFGGAYGTLNAGIASIEEKQQALAQGKQQILDAQLALSQQYASLKIMLTESLTRMQQMIQKDPSSAAELIPQLTALSDALLNLQGRTDLAYAHLGNSMAEVVSGQAILQMTVAQMEASMAQVESSEDAAITTANLTGMLTMNNVSAIIAAQNLDMPAGYIQDGNRDTLVSVGEKISDIRELKDLVVLDLGIKGQAPIKLSDVADVSNFNNADDLYAKINGEDGVLLTFQKQSNYPTTEVAQNIQDKFRDLEGSYEGLTFTTLSDQGQYIFMVIDSVLNDLWIGAILAILVLLYFLRDIRPTIITALSIPISLTCAIALMYFTGVTINVISLAGLAVGMGRLLDDSIIVVENMFRLRSMGLGKIQAAISGVSQMAGAITASTLTTVCVFLPLVFVSGITKQIFTDMALTVTYALMASLLVALTVVPTLGQSLLVKTGSSSVLHQNSKTIANYKKVVAYAVNHKVWVLSISLVLLFAAFGLAYAKGFEYMPEMASPEISATVEFPTNYTIDQTAEASNEISRELKNMDGVKTVSTMLASDSTSMLGIGSAVSDVTAISLYVLLDEDQVDQNPKVSRKIKSLANKFEGTATVIGGTDISSSAILGGGGVSINIYADDLDNLRISAQQIKKELSKVDGVLEVSDGSKGTVPELRITVDKNKAMKNGLTVAQVYGQVSSLLTKEYQSTSIIYDGNRRDVVVTGDAVKTLNSKDISGLMLSTKNLKTGETGEVALTEIAAIAKSQALSSITHVDQNRSIQVSATLQDGENVTLVTDQAKSQIGKLNLPGQVSYEFQGEDQAISDAMGQLLLMMALGLLLIYLVMVAQFQSLLSPFIVMLTVPLAFTGGLIALLVSGKTISVISMVGFIMLMGVIVNNAIVLIVTMNRFRVEGMCKREAIIEAGAARLRPVLMTAITTVLALIPMALGFGTGAELIQPVALVCVGGLTYGTFMTLLVIPALYDWLGAKKISVISEEELTIRDL